jgi:hypothetical protein
MDTNTVQVHAEFRSLPSQELEGMHLLLHFKGALHAQRGDGSAPFGTNSQRAPRIPRAGELQRTTNHGGSQRALKGQASVCAPTAVERDDVRSALRQKQ